MKVDVVARDGYSTPTYLAEAVGREVRRYSWIPRTTATVTEDVMLHTIEVRVFFWVMDSQTTDEDALPHNARWIMTTISETILMETLLTVRAPVSDVVHTVMMRLLKRFQDHEFDEWLKRDGVPLRNPHAKSTPPPGMKPVPEEAMA